MPFVSPRHSHTGGHGHGHGHGADVTIERTSSNDSDNDNGSVGGLSALTSPTFKPMSARPRQVSFHAELTDTWPDDGDLATGKSSKSGKAGKKGARRSVEGRTESERARSALAGSSSSGELGGLAVDTIDDGDDDEEGVSPLARAGATKAGAPVVHNAQRSESAISAITTDLEMSDGEREREREHRGMRAGPASPPPAPAPLLGTPFTSPPRGPMTRAPPPPTPPPARALVAVAAAVRQSVKDSPVPAAAVAPEEGVSDEDAKRPP